MLKDSLDGSKMIAISLLEPGWEEKEEPYPSYDLIGVGYVRACVTNHDGTSHIILHGIGRAKIRRYIQMTPYRMAEVVEVPDEEANPKALRPLVKRLKELFIKKVRLASETPQAKIQDAEELNQPRFLASICAHTAQIDFEEKQKLLEDTSLEHRLLRLIELLGEELFPKGSMN